MGYASYQADMFSRIPIPVLVVYALYLLGAFGVTIAVVVKAISRWGYVRRYLFPGFLLASVTFMLGIPMLVTQALYLELPLPEGVASLLGEEGWRVVIGAGAFVVAVLGAAACALQVAVGREIGWPSPYPLLCELDWRSLLHWLIGGAFGVVAAVASAFTIGRMDINAGELAEFGSAMMPQGMSTLMQFSNLLMTAIGGAVSEEILLRGVVQGWLARKLGPGRVGIAVAIVLASAFWAAGHVGLTDDPLSKCLQIFLIGLGLGAIARRYSVEASIVGHVALNVTVFLVLW